MRVSVRDFNAVIYQQIRAFLAIYPLPQVPHWETKALQFRAQGEINAAFYMIDRIASYYGKDVARCALERFTRLPLFLRGRGIPADWNTLTHPARYLLRDGMRPIVCNGKVLVRVGANVVAVAPDTPTASAFHVFDDIPTRTGFAGMGNIRRPIGWAPYADGFVYFEPKPHRNENIESDTGDKNNSELNSCTQNSEEYHATRDHRGIPGDIPHNRLYYVDLRQTDASIPLEIANKIRLRISYIEFDSDIRHISDPLDDGSIFITLSSPVPVLSDICRIVRLDRAKLRSVTGADTPDGCADLRACGAVSRDIVLPNTEQTLCNDCVAHGDVYLTCRGGMQNREIRFISPDGAWHTKFLHEAPVIAVMNAPSGTVSLDESGRAFLWQNKSPVDDCTFDIGKLPAGLRDALSDCLLSVDWFHKKLYVTEKSKYQKIDDILNNIRTFCVTTEDISNDYIIQRGCIGSPSTVVLRDGSFHFWSDATHGIDPAWQISKETSLAEDWMAILSSKDSPCVEDDPRIRWYAD